MERLRLGIIRGAAVMAMFGIMREKGTRSSRLD